MTDSNKLEDVQKQLMENYPITAEHLFAQIVPTSLDMLLTAVDQCRHFMNQSTSTFTGSAGREGHFSARERKELDEAVALFFQDIDGKAESEIERMGITEEALKEYGESHYPAPQEAIITATDLIFRKVYDEAIEQHFNKYGNDPTKFEYLITRVRLGRAGTIEAVLGDALVPLIVSKMEEFLAALVRIAVLLHPKSLGELPSIPNEIFRKYGSNFSGGEIELWQIDQKVNSFIKGSPSEWQETLVRWARIDVSNLGVDWNIITEMIQRRHAIVHNGGRVDADYLARVAKNLTYGLQLGSRLISNRSYLSPVLAELEAWVICLALRWGKHFFKDKNIYYPYTLGRITALEEAGRWSQALAVLDSFLLDPLPPNSDGVELAKINRWYCLQELGRYNDALRREIADIDENNLYFALGKYALLREYRELETTVRRATEGREPVTTKKYLREMPLFQRVMRESPQIKSILLRTGPAPQRASPKNSFKKRARR